MKKEVICTGKTIDDAINEACLQLGCTREEADVEVLEAPSKKILGLIGGNDAKVKVTADVADKAAPAATATAEAASDSSEDTAPAAQIDKGAALGTAVEKYITEVVSLMGIKDFTVTAKQDADSLRVYIEGSDLGAVIGHRGDTLDALQHLANLVNRRDGGNGSRVILDCGDYRAKRESYLTKTARSAIARAARNNRSIALEPMNAYERRFIHTIVQDAPGVKSWSVGEDPYRKVIIASETAPEYTEAPRRGGFRNDRSDSNRGGRNQGNRGDRRSSDRRNGDAPKSEHLVYEHEVGAPIGTRTARIPHPKRDISSGKAPANDEFGGNRTNDGEFFSLYEKITPVKKDEE